MAHKQKACKTCRAVFDSGTKCPKCGSEEINDHFKGKVVILNPEESEIAQKVNIKEKGVYAIKV